MAMDFFPKTVFTAGKVKRGEVIIHKFDYCNTSPQDIEILEVRPGCGCVAGTIPTKTIPPGAKGAIEVSVKTLSQPEGKQRWYAHVRLRQGKSEVQVPLQILAEVETEISVQPASLHLTISKSFQQKLTIEDRRANPLKIIAIRASHPGLKVHSGTFYKEKGIWKMPFEVSIPDDFPSGRHEEKIVILTDEAIYRLLEVPLVINRREANSITALPARADIVGSRDSGVVSRIVLLRSQGDAPVKIKHAKGSHAAITCRWASGPENLATLKIQVDPALVSEEILDSTVEVHLAAPSEESVSIPLRFRID